MAKDKKSFVLYTDLIGRTEHLTIEEKGILFQHLIEYVNDLNPILEDRVLIGVWKPIEQQLKRDLKKFEEVKTKRSEAGKESARLRALKKEKQTLTNSTSVKSVQQTSTNSTVNDSVSVSDNEIIDKSITIKEKEFDAFRKEYKTYATELYKDNVFIEAVSRNHIKHSNNEVNKKTIHKYLKLFLTHLDETQEKHHNKKDFQYHFSNWLRKQTIEFATVKKEPLRHW